MYFCEDCDKGVGEAKYCFTCDYCKDCCACQRPKNFTSQLTFFLPTRSQKKHNKSSRLISAEIEVASISKNKNLVEKTVADWEGSIVHDGTLPAAGFEINTAPAGGDVYIAQVFDICEALEAAGAKVDKNCGLHVHVDARDFNYNDLYKLTKIYTAIEPTLLAMVPANRHSSEYAIKCGNIFESKIKKSWSNEKLTHLELKDRIVTAIYNTGHSAFRTNKRGAGLGTGRYYALNLHSWFYRGTIECRLFDGTVNKNEIIEWGILWANILDFAVRMSDDEVSSMMKKDKPYESLISIVKDDKELKSFIDYRYNKHKPKKVKKTKALGYLY